ncbi:lipocalin family protein [Dyadobacter flavalbus]|nr:lipocalin family protein [Dyadobacter flavalbus]
MKNLNRKNLGSIVLFLFMAAGIVSCNKDSNDPKPEEPVKENSVQGSWKISAMNIDPAQDGITDILEYIESMTGNHCISETVFKFEGNGKIDGTVPAGCTVDDTEVIEDNATWKVTGNKIQIIEGSETSEYDLEVGKTEMKWTTQEVEDGVTYKLTIVFKKA